MLRRCVFFAALFPALALAAPPPLKGAVFPYPMQVSKLKNGLTVVRVPFNSPGLIAYYTVVRVGSRNEVEPGHTGFAHFFEHMMFRGTKKWPEGARGAMLGKQGFSENAFTSDDVTVYLVNGPSSGLEQLIDVEADRFMNLDYAEQAFQTEARAVLGEYNKNAANPALKIEEAVLGAAFTTHTYRHTTLGFLEDIQAMPTRYEYSKQFFKRWYTPDNCLVFIVGDFDGAKALEWAEKSYGSWAGKASDVKVPAEPPQKEAKVAQVTWSTPTLPRTALYWHTPAASLTATDGAAQQVLAQYLAGPTSPLYKAMVLEQQLVERIGPSYGDHRDPNLFGVEARLKEEGHRAAVDKAVLDAVAEVAKGKVDARRLQDIKDNMKYGLLMGLETQDQVAVQLAYTAGVLGAPDALDTIYKQMANVAAKDLVAFAKKHLVDANRTTLVFTVDAKGGGK